MSELHELWTLEKKIYTCCCSLGNFSPYRSLDMKAQQKVLTSQNSNQMQEIFRGPLYSFAQSTAQQNLPASVLRTSDAPAPWALCKPQLNEQTCPRSTRGGESSAWDSEVLFCSFKAYHANSSPSPARPPCLARLRSCCQGWRPRQGGGQLSANISSIITAFWSLNHRYKTHPLGNLLKT